jgi:dinuclear metal center protein, YbgI/SA1388 family
MSTAMELYKYLNNMIPATLSLEWDNDGLMCAAGIDDVVKNVMLTLDVTETAVDYAVEKGIDTIISHHPLIFKPLKNIENNKLVKLIQNNITVMSFHTRLDIIENGVNTQFANLLELTEIETFGGLGKVGLLPREYAFYDFVKHVKGLLKCEHISAVKKNNTVSRVALTGGDGKDFYKDALNSGADTYLTGNLSYNMMTDAAENPMNVIEAGHYQTENFICKYLEKLVLDFDGTVITEIFDSNRILYL